MYFQGVSTRKVKHIMQELCGFEITNAHAGLKAARKTVIPGIVWQRCHFHIQQNAQSYITHQSKNAKCGRYLTV